MEVEDQLPEQPLEIADRELLDNDPKMETVRSELLSQDNRIQKNQQSKQVDSTLLIKANSGMDFERAKRIVKVYEHLV